MKMRNDLQAQNKHVSINVSLRTNYRYEILKKKFKSS